MLKFTFLVVSLAFGVFQAAEVSDNGDCDKLGIVLYEDIGCKPVMKQGCKCPVKYDCNFEVKNNTCLFRGRSITLGEPLANDETYDTCTVGCFCDEPGKFTCAVLDCHEWFDGGVPLKAGCYRKYDVDECCSVGENCQSPTKKFGECNVDGKKYLEGQKFNPKNTCIKCVCPKNFNGKFKEPYCKKQRCAVQIRNSDKIEQNCAPYYDNSDGPICCPSAWVCPSRCDKVITINTRAEKNPDLTCKFGHRTLQLGEGFFTKVDYYGTPKDAKCECILPPWLTCRRNSLPAT